MLRIVSPPAERVVTPTPSSSPQMAGTSSSLTQCNWTDCLVVKSTKPLPNSGLSAGAVDSRGDFADGAELVGFQSAVGVRQPHHEVALLAAPLVEHTPELEAREPLVVLVFGNRVEPLLGELQNLLADGVAVQLLFPFFLFVYHVS